MRVLRVRPEGPADAAAIRTMHRAAFGGGEPAEAALVDALRADAGWLPGLSLVAVGDGNVVGHVVATRARLDDVPALGVGAPLPGPRPGRPADRDVPVRGAVRDAGLVIPPADANLSTV